MTTNDSGRAPTIAPSAAHPWPNGLLSLTAAVVSTVFVAVDPDLVGTACRRIAGRYESIKVACFGPVRE